MKHIYKKSDIALLSIAAGLSVVTFLASLATNNPSLSQQLGPLQTLFLVIFVVWHGGRLLGFKGLAAFFVISQVVSNIMENLSISTGVPFGDYHYSSGGLPFLFQVPMVIGIAYFAYGYLAWVVATLLLGYAQPLVARAYSVLLPITAAFVMVMWDVAMDPINSTIKHYWIWENGGGFNGVPLTNYLGWFLTVYIFYQIFALYLRKSGSIQRQISKALWAAPVVVYAATALSFIVMFAVAPSRDIADATGRVWNVAAIYETAAVVSIFTMLFVSFLALVHLLRPQGTPLPQQAVKSSRGATRA